MKPESEMGSPGGAQLVITITAVRAPVGLVRDLVDVERHVTPAGGEVLIGIDESYGRLGLFVAGAVAIHPAAAPAPSASSNGHRLPKRTPRPRSEHRPPRVPVGAGLVPTDWLAVLQALHANGDTIGDVRGRATRELAKVMGLELEPRTLGQLLNRLKKMEQHHYISRASKATATYEIRLDAAGLAIVDQSTAESPPVELTDNHRGGSGDTVVAMNTPGPGRDTALQDRLRGAAAQAMYAND